MRLEALESPPANANLLFVAEERLKQLRVERVEGESGVWVLWAVRVFDVELCLGGNVVRKELSGGILLLGEGSSVVDGGLDAVHGLGAGLAVMVVGHGVVFLSVREVRHGWGWGGGWGWGWNVAVCWQQRKRKE